MIKKRTRPQGRARLPSSDVVDSVVNDSLPEDLEDASLPLADLLELRKLRRSRQGIESTKLIVGDAKKRRKLEDEYEKTEPGGLRSGAGTPSASEVHAPEGEDVDQTDADARARKSVRTSNFTQQTNTLDVDKHMMAYIEEEMSKRKGPKPVDTPSGPADPYAELHNLTNRYKNVKNPADEGNVAGSLSMLTAIPEVDLGMNTRLKNIEETERAKAMAAETPRDRRPVDDGAPSRFFLGNTRPKSDADIIRDAQREALGLPPADDAPRPSHGNQTATDEAVMERFKKRMRK